MGNVTQYARDHAGRLISITYGGRLKNGAPGRHLQLDNSTWRIRNLDDANIIPGDHRVEYAYGTEGGATGKVIRIQGPGGSITNQYDPFGRLVRQERTIAGGPALLQEWEYDRGRLKSHTLPGGQILDYSYANGDLAAIHLDGKPVLADIKHHPAGGLSSATWGNGLEYRATYDPAGRVTSRSRGGESVAYAYDEGGNITRQGEKTYEYDPLGRLVGAKNIPLPGSLAKGDIGYAYDANGNRTKITLGEEPIDYALETGSNRIAKAGTDAYRYDEAGNRIEDGNFRYEYNARNRLESVTDKKTGATTGYRYNALGQRIAKTHGGRTTYYIYNPSGMLVAEATAREGQMVKDKGQITKQYLWMGTTPIGVIEDGRLYYIHADHLGTPRAATDERGEVVWRWRSTPFGLGEPEERGLTLNLRFPGHYFDRETGLHYNMARYYDPETGAYLRPEPTGQAFGTNPYQYAKGADPLEHANILYKPIGCTH